MRGLLDGFGVVILKLDDGSQLIERGFYQEGLKEGWIRETSTSPAKLEGLKGQTSVKIQLVKPQTDSYNLRDLESEVKQRHDQKSIDTSWSFSGEYSAGYRHGIGILKRDQGRTEIRGNWIDGNIDGFSVKRVKDQGNNFRYIYEGDLVGDSQDGNMHGIGRFEDKGLDNTSGAVYIGVFENGQRNGFGQYKDKNTLYVGGWNMEKKNGVGFQKYFDTSSYFGYWLNNMRDGLGLWLAADGKEVRGEWKNDQLHGRVYIRLRDSNQSMFVMYKQGKLVEHL